VKREAIKRTLIPALRLVRVALLWAIAAFVVVLLLADLVVWLWMRPRTG
jgi:hypothetical protein